MSYGKMYHLDSLEIALPMSAGDGIQPNVPKNNMPLSILKQGLGRRLYPNQAGRFTIL
jgi:hypothetical protein